MSLFPHEVSDLAILLSAFSDGQAVAHASWHTRYVLLLWLSLVCRLPFALDSVRPPPPKASTSTSAAAQGEGLSAGETIERIGMRYLGSSSKESDGAVSLLGRYYSR